MAKVFTRIMTDVDGRVASFLLEEVKLEWTNYKQQEGSRAHQYVTQGVSLPSIKCFRHKNKKKKMDLYKILAPLLGSMISKTPHFSLLISL